MRSLLFGVLAWLIVPVVAMLFAAPAVLRFLPQEVQSNLYVTHLQQPALLFHNTFPEVSAYHLCISFAGIFCVLLLVKRFYSWQASRYSVLPYKKAALYKKHMRTCKDALALREDLHSQFIKASVHED